MADPPLLVALAEMMVAVVVDAVPLTDVGVDGAVTALVTVADAAGPVPTVLTACTVRV